MKAILITVSLVSWVGLAQLPAKEKRSAGLIVEEYVRHEDQAGKGEFYVEPRDFGEPLGDPYRIESLQGWKHGTDRNAIASGFLEIAKPGVYEFRTNSYYDRNQLRVDGKIVCHYQDGTDRVKRAKLEKGQRRIESIGFVASRGETVGITVEWRPPGQQEFGPIPAKLLSHESRKGLRRSPYEKPPEAPEVSEKPIPPTTPSDLVARELTIVAKDFVVEIYHNGRRLNRNERKMVLDRFGATAEKATINVRPGDWLVFHVAVNRLRHGGSRYFAVTGHLDEEQVGFVSDTSEAWSSCDHPSLAHDFIHFREAGTESRVVKIDKKLEWHEGRKFMESFSGTEWTGDAIWGTAASTWIKFRALGAPGPVALSREAPASEIPVTELEVQFASAPVEPGEQVESKADEASAPAPKPEVLAVTAPKQRPVQIISAVYGTGGKNADVTEKVREYVEEKRAFFAANPGHLGVDPNPYWNKGLRIVYMKDGVRRQQRRNENEHILPESFYGPQDTAELAEWLEGTRWLGPKGEIQFHPNGRLAGPEIGTEGDWRSLGSNRVQIHWPKEEEATEYRFDYTWSSFRVPDDGANEYRVMR